VNAERRERERERVTESERGCDYASNLEKLSSTLFNSIVACTGMAANGVWVVSNIKRNE